MLVTCVCLLIGNAYIDLGGGGGGVEVRWCALLANKVGEQRTSQAKHMFA